MKKQNNPNIKAHLLRGAFYLLVALCVIPFALGLPQANTNTPVLVVTTDSNQFSKYYSEILKAEGLNAFQTADIGTVNPAALANYDTVLLGEVSLTPTQVTTFTDWVNAGGNLIAMKPDKQLAGLLGLTDASSTLADKYLLVNTLQIPVQVSLIKRFNSTAVLICI